MQADVEAVADLAVQRVVDAGGEAFGVGAVVRHQPRAAGSVQADRRPRLPRDAAQLADRGARAARHGQGQSAVGKHGPAGRVLGAVDQAGRAVWQSRGRQRRLQRRAHDGARGAQRVGADPEHHRIAGAQHPGGVGEHIGPALEHETHHAQRRGDLFQRPPLVFDPLDRPPSRALGVPPFAQAGDHVAPHASAQRQPRRGAAPRLGGSDICGIGRGDGGPDSLVRQGVREAIEEAADLGVGRRAHLPERRLGPAHRVLGDLGGRGGHMQQIAGILQHDQPVPGLERRRQRLRHDRDAVPAKGNWHAGGQSLKHSGGHAGVLAEKAGQGTGWAGSPPLACAG